VFYPSNKQEATSLFIAQQPSRRESTCVYADKNVAAGGWPPPWLLARPPRLAAGLQEHVEAKGNLQLRSR
jgi:hypothetical protein